MRQYPPHPSRDDERIVVAATATTHMIGAAFQKAEPKTGLTQKS